MQQNKGIPANSKDTQGNDDLRKKINKGKEKSDVVIKVTVPLNKRPKAKCKVASIKCKSKTIIKNRG
jgi:hypothetical protein